MIRRTDKGFTLIEVLVVVAVIAILASVLLPSLGKARELAKRAVCAGNFKNVGNAWHMYANDHRDWYPASHAGGAWSLFYDFNKFYFDKRKQGGDIFMCPTWIPRINAQGQPNGWDNLAKITGSLGHAVPTGYDFWTHMVWDPYKPNGKIELIPVREHSQKYKPPSMAGSWAEALVDRGQIVPWLNKSTDMGGQVRDTSVTTEWVYNMKRVAPSDQRMSWDQVQASTVDCGSTGYCHKTVRHYWDGPTGANVLYGDGHIEWQRFEEMLKISMGGGYAQHY